ncbi:MAG TPA: hypothetical protein VLK33_17495 [Terriglobales bacterium]|nr:hypothetical protein [Terriglobales bacterium]
MQGKKQALATYLQDHLAGSVQAIELIDSIRQDHRNEELGEFASRLMTDVKSDQEILRRVADTVGAGPSSLKETTAWIAEKLTLIKLHRKSNSGLGVFEALEFLELGIHGKWTLWRALGELAHVNSDLDSFDFAKLAESAARQRSEVEAQRLKLVRKTF